MPKIKKEEGEENLKEEKEESVKEDRQTKATIFKNGMRHERAPYTLKENGKDFKMLAEQFANKLRQEKPEDIIEIIFE